MEGLNIKKLEFMGWENCVELTNGQISLVVTLDVGPRIVFFGFSGSDNMLCELSEQQGKKGASEWTMYGGHRLWHSPEEKPRTYQPDNSPVSWEQTADGVIITQPTENWTNIKKQMEIKMSSSKAEVEIVHRLTNLGAWDIELSAWAITVMAPGGKEIIPQPTRDTGLLPNRMLSLWPYTKLNDPRVYWGEKYIMIDQDINAKTPFKIGLPNEDGWAAYVNKGNMFVKKYVHQAGVKYPDFSASSYETYTIDFMLEMETLSPLTVLKPGAAIEHSEKWLLFSDVSKPQDESEIEQKIVPLIQG